MERQKVFKLIAMNCPFCGSLVTRINDYTSRKGQKFHAECNTCKARGPLATTLEEATAKWNATAKAMADARALGSLDATV